MKQTLLLVDDDANILDSLRRVLRRDGYDIVTSSSGEAGLKLLRENEVHVVVSDLRMPGMNGLEFLTQAKAQYPEVVRIVLTGYPELETVLDAVNRGVIYKFITKPISPEALQAHIREAFLHYEVRAENGRLSARLQKDLISAREVQCGLLPAASTEPQPVTGINIPARQVSGDLYDYFVLDDGRVYSTLR